MAYTVNWEESLKDYVRHHDYLMSRLGRISRWPLLIVFTIEAVLLIIKGKLLFSIICMVFIFLAFSIYFFPMLISARTFIARTRRHGADSIMYTATIGENNIIINNVTEGISTTRNYCYLGCIVKKNVDMLIGVGYEYICIDRKKYSDEIINEMVDFMLDREAECQQYSKEIKGA